MKLSGKQIGEIQDALLDAYPDRDALRMMVRIELEENLESIADGSNQRVVIFNLINWADRVGCVDALIQGAYRQNDGNFALQRLMESWRATERPATDRTSFSRFPQTLAGRASVNIFLCYSRKDSGVMRKVKESLRDAGLVVWTDEGLEPGTPAWQDAIEDAANQAQAMVVLLSPNAKKSQWVKNEVSFAQTQGKRVFPLLVDGNERNSIPIDLINTQWVDGRRQVEVVVRQSLLPAIQKSIYGSVPPPSLSPAMSPLWRWLGLEAVILILLVAFGGWVLVSFGIVRLGPPIPEPFATIAVPNALSVPIPTDTLPGSLIPETAAVASNAPVGTATIAYMQAPEHTHTATTVPTATAATAVTRTPESTGYPLALTPTAYSTVEPAVTDTFLPTVTPVRPSIKTAPLPRDGISHLAGVAEPGATVEILVDRTVVGIIEADDEGRWQFDVRIIAPGEHVVEVVTSAGIGVASILVPEPTPAATATRRLTSTPTVISTRMPTNTPTPTTTSTSTSTPTPRPLPTSTAMPTTIETRVDAFELPLAIEVIGIQVTDASVIGTNATLRSGPGTAFDVVAQAAPDQLIQIAAISEDGQWYLLVSGEWIARFLVAEQPADVPVVNDQILQVIQAVTSARTPTAIATPEALATPGHFVSTVTVDANLRAGPGTEFDLLAGTVTGQEINIVGRSSDGDWFRLDNGGWVSGSLVANPPALDTVPIVNANGTPVEVVTEPTVIPKAGATQINPKDGAVLVYVIAGWFTMGSDMDQNAWDNEKPQSHLRLDAFWIMRTEVTNAQYAKCVQAGVCTEPGNTRWNDAAYAEHPVTDVSWYQASEYAQWVGGRLPTEAEWEKACRGPDKRTYTWGDAPPTKVHANFGMLVGDTTPVGSYPKRASPYGVLDMAGNVWEWTSSQFVGYPYDPNDGREDPPQSTQKVLRGGSYGDHVRYMRCAARQGFDSRDAVRSVGFRVVLPP